MSCFGCGKKYGLFCKEHGCPNCGYSYCAKCLKRPISVPRHDNKVLNVCLICYDKLSKMQALEKVIDCDALPGTLITKPLRKANNSEALIEAAALFEDNPPENLDEVLKPISISPSGSSPPRHSRVENAEFDENLDSVISKRLKNLKAIDNMPTDNDIRSRLANLNGLPQREYSNKDILLSADQRTDQEKMNDLVTQFMGEVRLDQRIETERNDAISDIERRLNALREGRVYDNAAGAVGGSGPANKDTSPDTNSTNDNEEDEATALKKIIEKYLTESRLPSALETELAAGMPQRAGNSAADTEELPWCNICNEDAVFRCKGCDGELFCAQCYRDCHDDDEEYRAHVREAYKAPPRFKEDHF